MRGAHVDYGDIHSVSLNNVHQVIRRGVRLPNRHVRVCYPILTQNGLNLVVVDVRERDGVCNGYTALILPSNHDRWWSLVQSNSKTFEFGFDNFFVAEGFEDVQDDED